MAILGVRFAHNHFSSIVWCVVYVRTGLISHSGRPDLDVCVCVYVCVYVCVDAYSQFKIN